MISLNDFIAIGGFILGIITAFAGWLAWYGSSVKKRYAAERDFAHLKRNYEQLAENQKEMIRLLDDLTGDIALVINKILKDKDKDN